eukprot:TRINITY_DN8453_c0_g1_i1.p1 TRINITY_DN8453_c0_g1~~TRINITY_DN8453_c0_g1_i1.p1  ORF type:complete len:472 (+),score=47.99 TRINITY_DN8453_c0_g1_i1:46-1461(+)
MTEVPDCGICLDPVPETSDKFCSLDTCCHKYCYGCILDWSKISTRCPLCKVHFSAITQAGADGQTKCLKVTRKELKIDEGLPDYNSDESDSFVVDDDDVEYSNSGDVGSWEYEEWIQSQRKRKRSSQEVKEDIEPNKRMRTLPPPVTPVNTSLQDDQPKPTRPAFKTSLSQPLHSMARTGSSRAKPAEMKRSQSLSEMAKLRQQVEQSRRQLQVLTGRNGSNTNTNNNNTPTRGIQRTNTPVSLSFNNNEKNNLSVEDPLNDSTENLEPKKLTSSDLFRNVRFEVNPNPNSLTNNIKAATNTANNNQTNTNGKLLSSVLSHVKPAPPKRTGLGVQSNNILLQSAQSSLERFHRNSQDSSSPSPRESRHHHGDKENKQPSRHFDNIQQAVPMDYTTKQICFHANVYIKTLLQPHYTNGAIDKERFKAIVVAALEEFKTYLHRGPHKRQQLDEVSIEPFKSDLQLIVTRLMTR